MIAIKNAFAASPVLALISENDVKTAVRVASALEEGGVTAVEVVLRTPSALDCLEAVAGDCPNLIVGAGTVINSDQAAAVIERGAKFIVSPGLDQGVVDCARSNGLPVFPGVMTPSECQRAANMGLGSVKFFPAGLAGGAPMLKALSAVFQQMTFIPTGGVSAENLGTFLSVPAVIACGGSWLTPKDKIAQGDFDAVTRLASEAVQIAHKTRP